VADDKVNVSGVISVEDKASPTIRAIQKNIAGIGDAARKVGAQFSRFANMGALGGVAANAQKAAGAMRTLAGSIIRVGGSMAALAGIAGFGGLVYEIQNYVSSTDDLAKSAQRIGTTVEELQKLRHVATLSGVSVETMDSALLQFNKRLAEAATGKGKDLAALLQKAGISMKDATGRTRSAAEILPQLASAFAATKDQGTRTRIALAAFGKAGQELIPVLAGGGKEMKAMMAEMVSLGLITTEQAKEAEALNDAQDRMNKSVRGVSNAIMGSLVPAITPLVEQFTEWVKVNRAWISMGVTKFVKDFGNALANVPWDEVIEGAKEMGAAFKYLFDAVGGVKAVLPAFAALMGGIVLSSIWPVVSALGALSVALLTNPITATLIGIAAAAYLIYRNWEPIKKFFADLWENATKNFNDAKAMLGDFIAGFVPDAIKEAWAPLPEWWSNLWGRFTRPIVQGPDMPAPPPKLKDASMSDIAADAAVQWARLKEQVTGVATAIHEAFKPGQTLGWTDALVSGDFGAAVKQKMAEFKAGFMTSGVIADFKAYFKPDEVIASWRDYDWTGAAKGFVDRFKAGFMTSGFVADFKALFNPEGVIASWEGVNFGSVWARVKGSFDTASGWLSQFKADFAPGDLTASWQALDFGSVWTKARGAFDAAVGWLGTFRTTFVPGNMEGEWQGVDFGPVWNRVRAAFDTASGWLTGFLTDFAPGGWLDLWRTAASGLAAIWDNPRAAFDTALAWVQDFATRFVPGGWLDLWQSAASGLSLIWNAPGEAFDRALASAQAFLAAFTPGNMLAVWQSATAALSAAWDNPRAAFQAAQAALAEFAARYVPEPILAAWQAVGATLAAVWNAPGQAYDAAIVQLAEFAARFVPAPIVQAWSTVAGFFQTLWDQVTGIFQQAWATIKPIIDAIMAAIQPLLSAVQGVGNAASNIGGKIAGAAGGAADAARGYLPTWLGGTPAEGGGAAPAMPSPTPVSPVSQASQANPAVARLDGQVETRIKIDVAPGLLASATTQDRGQVNSTVDVGTSMVPA
jgi:phage-related minor tail protein